MDVSLLYFEGCPSWRLLHDRLQEALSSLGHDSGITLVPVGTAEEAERWSFRGSPTVLIDGVDPFGDEQAPIGLCCRVYPTPDGLAGAPTLAQLLDALA